MQAHSDNANRPSIFVNTVNVTLAHAHLLAEPEIKPLISRFLVHVAGYRLIIEAWEAGDYSRHISLVEFPEGIRAVLEKRLVALMAEQDRYARRWLF